MTMAISHPTVDAAHARSDQAFVFSELGGYICSICAPISWGVDKVIDFAESKFPSSHKRWVSVDKAAIFQIGVHTPNPCNVTPTLRTHWFMMRGVT